MEDVSDEVFLGVSEIGTYDLAGDRGIAALGGGGLVSLGVFETQLIKILLLAGLFLTGDIEGVVGVADTDGEPTAVDGLLYDPSKLLGSFSLSLGKDSFLVLPLSEALIGVEEGAGEVDPKIGTGSGDVVRTVSEGI